VWKPAVFVRTAHTASNGAEESRDPELAISFTSSGQGVRLRQVVAVDLDQLVDHEVRQGLPVGSRGVCDPRDYGPSEFLLAGAAITGWEDNEAGVGVVACVHRPKVGCVIGYEDVALTLDELSKLRVFAAEHVSIAIARRVKPEIVRDLD